MWSLVIVESPPLVEAVLALCKVTPVVTGQQICFERAVEAFVFALGLGVVGAAVDDFHAQAQQPYAERGGFGARAAPRRAVVAKDLFRQAVPGEDSLEAGLHGEGLFVAARFQSQGVARVIVEQSQWVAASTSLEPKVAFEVHLPELIWRSPFEALAGAMRLSIFFLDTAVAAQDAVHRAHRRQFLMAQIKESLVEFARAPGGLFVSQLEHQALLFRWRLVAAPTALGALILQAPLPVLAVALQPFVTGLRTNPKSLA